MSKSIEYPVCVRHAQSRKDVRLRHFFLCDQCSSKWVSEAFGGNGPLYEGERVTGYCGLCNTIDNGIRLRTWFLCDNCQRVAASIGRNHVAEMAILDYWQRYVRSRPQFASLQLVQNDPSALRPRRSTDESGVAPLDFLVIDESSGRIVFGIENKTGRSPVRGAGAMSQFQLDVSDCDCIVSDMRRHQIPAYVIHAQVLELWRPPTCGYQIASLWWSDVYTMTEHFKELQRRRDEQRRAAYFGKKAFSTIDTFVDELWGTSDFAIVERFRELGIPQMYFEA